MPSEILNPGLPSVRASRALPDYKFRTHGFTEYLYVFRCERFYKIGVSRSPELRLADMRNSCPFQIAPIGYRRMHRGRSVAVEHLVHLALKSKWTHGEWFAVTEQEIKTAISDALVRVTEIGTDSARRMAHSRRFIKTEIRLGA